MKNIAVISIVFLTILLWNCQSQTATEVSEEAPTAKSDWMDAGAEITAAVGKTLLSTVQQKMGEGGVEGAIDYCRLNALPITDSLARHYNVEIKRTALRTRNEKNKPTASEMEVFTKMATMHTPKPILQFADGHQPVYYAPITLNDFCQVCHGTLGETMTFETDSLIKMHYPLDEATGFITNDLRGMWVVQFNESLAQ